MTVEIRDKLGPRRTVIIRRDGEVFINGTIEGRRAAEQEREAAKERTEPETEMDQ